MLDEVVTWLGGPLGVLQWLGVVAWVLLMLVALAAVLGAVLVELRPWMPTTPGEEMPTLTEAEKTALYGAQGPVEPLVMDELANGSTVQPRSRQRPLWLRTGRGQD